MRIRTSVGTLVVWGVAAVVLGVVSVSVIAGEKGMHLEALLVWGTSENPAPTTHKPVEPDVAKKLRTSFKWDKYFEVNRNAFVVPESGKITVPVSKKCALEVKRLQGETLEVGYIGSGKPVERRIITLTRGNPLIYGGNAPNSNAWFVVVKRVD